MRNKIQIAIAIALIAILGIKGYHYVSSLQSKIYMLEVMLAERPEIPVAVERRIYVYKGLVREVVTPDDMISMLRSDAPLVIGTTGTGVFTIANSIFETHHDRPALTINTYEAFNSVWTSAE